jgi:hypothetical protein
MLVYACLRATRIQQFQSIDPKVVYRNRSVYCSNPVPITPREAHFPAESAATRSVNGKPTPPEPMRSRTTNVSRLNLNCPRFSITPCFCRGITCTHPACSSSFCSCVSNLTRWPSLSICLHFPVSVVAPASPVSQAVRVLHCGAPESVLGLVVCVCSLPRYKLLGVAQFLL